MIPADLTRYENITTDEISRAITSFNWVESSEFDIIFKGEKSMEEIEQLYQWGIWTECYTTRLFDLTDMKVNNENNWIDHHYHLYSIVWSFLDKKRHVYRICPIFLDGRILYDG